MGGIVPGIERDPLKKLVADEEGLLKLLYRWRDEAVKAGHKITRMVVAFEAGRDGFWLARWLRARGIEAYVIHSTSVAVSREQRRARTDRLDIALLKKGRVNGTFVCSRPSPLCHRASLRQLPMARRLRI